MKNSILVIKPFNFVIFLTIFIPLQEPILNWLPVPDGVHLWLRLVSEFILYLLVGLVIFNKVINNHPLKKSPIDLLILAFIVLSIFSMITQKSFTFDGINNLRSLLRFLAVYYLIINLSINSKQISLLLTILLSIGIIEGFIALGQFISDDFNKLFIIRNPTAEIAGIKKVFIPAKAGAVYGTFGSETDMALYMLAALVIALTIGYFRTHNTLPELKYIGIILIIIWGIFATFKRAAILGIPVVFGSVLFFSGKKRQLSLTVFLSILLLVILLFLIFWGFFNFDFGRDFQGVRYRSVEEFSLVDYFSNPFTAGYWQHLIENQRIWFIIEVSKVLINDFNLIGYGPDPLYARTIISEFDPDKFYNFTRPKYTSFEDVYWVAMYAYYGAIGLVLYLSSLFLLFMTSVRIIRFSNQQDIKILGVVFCSIMVLTIIFTFVYRTFEFKAFGYSFWLLAGLVVNAYNQLKGEGKAQTALEDSLDLSLMES